MRDARLAMWERWTISVGAAVAVAGCACAPPPNPVDAAMVDAPTTFDPGEPCAVGVRRALMDLLPLAWSTRSANMAVAGDGDRVWVAQVDVIETTVVRITELDLDGARVAIHEAPVPGDNWTPLSVSGEGAVQALLGNTSRHELALVVVPAGGGAPRVSVHDVGVSGVGASAALGAGGFLTIARQVDHDMAVWSVREGSATATPLPVTSPSFVRYNLGQDDPGWSLTAPDSAGRYVAITIDGDGRMLAVEIDPTGAEPEVRIVETGEIIVSTIPHVEVARVAGGGVVVMARVEMPDVGVHVTWLDDELAVRARADLVVGGTWVEPIGVVPGERELLAFTWFGPAGTRDLRVAAAHPSGHVAGGARTLVRLPEPEVRPVGWSSIPGAISVANGSDGLEVVTLCAAP